MSAPTNFNLGGGPPRVAAPERPVELDPERLAIQAEPPADDGPWAAAPPPGFFEDGDDAPSELAAGGGGRVIEHVGADAIFAPQPPPDWICEGLRFARGLGVACFGGFGFSGKTIIAQSIAMSVATGRDAFGMFPVKRGRVLHLDYEQGSRLTRDRYQRLARGMGVLLEDIGDRLRLAVFPAAYLDDPDAADVFARAIEGFDLVIVDALRGAAPTLEENSSDVRRVLDLLARQSERFGALPLTLAHARKPTRDAGGAPAAGDSKFNLRGSSAIFDALTELFVLSAAKGAPTRVEHEKDRITGVPLPDFGLQIEDVEGTSGACAQMEPRWGLRVVHLDRAQLDRTPAAGGALLKHAERIVAWLAASGGLFAGSRGALQKSIAMNRTSFFEAISTLEGSGRLLVDSSKRTGPRISLISGVSP